MKIIYAVSYGLHGCYLPNSQSGPLYFSTRRELMDFIKHELKFYDMPQSLAREVKMRDRLWPFLKRYGSSSAHFSLVHNGYCLHFEGLTEDEAQSMEAAQ